MKAVIPVAGAGTKLRPLTFTQPKPLIPVAGKPIISYIIDQLYSAGINDFVFIIGYLGDKIREYIESNYPMLDKAFVYQSKRLGLGHAIWTARNEFTKDEELVIVLGDTIVEVDIKDFVGQQKSLLGIKKVADPRDFGVVELDSKGKVIKVVEKPNIPKSNLALVGLYKFLNAEDLTSALDYLIEHDIKTHDEFQLTDAIMLMIERGNQFNTMDVNNWYDCGKKDILLETNAMLLDQYHNVEVKEHTFESTILIPPVSIGDHCQIKNSVIGPNVTIGHNTKLNYAIVKDSIIGDYTSIEEVILVNSVIGNDTIINGLTQSLNIGDNTEIDMS